MAKAAKQKERAIAKKMIPAAKKVAVKKSHGKKLAAKLARALPEATAPAKNGFDGTVLDRLWHVVLERRDADIEVSHSARLMARGTAKVAQKFGEEAVECVIEAVAGNRGALINESADVLYHMIVMWVNAGVRAEEIWAELGRREGISGIAEKAARTLDTRKIP